MGSKLHIDSARALLTSTQALRTHWSGLIINLMYLVILLNLANWTIFMQMYFSVFRENGVWDHSYIAFASTITVVSLTFWRWHTKQIDDGIARLYPEFIYFEGALSCPPQFATSRYLQQPRALGDAGEFLQRDTLTYGQKAEVLGTLVDKRLVGARLHDKINWFALSVTVIMTIIIFGLGIFGLFQIGGGAMEQGIIRPELKWICGTLSILSIVLLGRIIVKRQRTPSKRQVEDIIKTIINK